MLSGKEALMKGSRLMFLNGCCSHCSVGEDGEWKLHSGKRKHKVNVRTVTEVSLVWQCERWNGVRPATGFRRSQGSDSVVFWEQPGLTSGKSTHLIDRLSFKMLVDHDIFGRIFKGTYFVGEEL